MTQNPTEKQTPAWDNWWREGQEGGAQDPTLRDYWQRVLEQTLTRPVRMLDLACGAGAVTAIANSMRLPTGATLDCTCLDASADALAIVAQRLPGVHTLQASAASTGLGDASFDFIASQFGLEYAGTGAFAEAARLLAPGGQLVLIVHYREGAIDEESRTTCEAIAQTLELGVLDAFDALLQAALALRSGAGNAEAFTAADQTLAPRVQQFATLLKDRGPAVAGGSLAQLFNDLAGLYQSLESTDLTAAREGVERASRDLKAFAQRMQAMREVALSAEEVAQIIEALGIAGLEMAQPETLKLGGRPLPAAWILRGQRP